MKRLKNKHKRTIWKQALYLAMYEGITVYEPRFGENVAYLYLSQGYEEEANTWFNAVNRVNNFLENQTAR